MPQYELDFNDFSKNRSKLKVGNDLLIHLKGRQQQFYFRQNGFTNEWINSNSSDTLTNFSFLAGASLYTTEIDAFNGFFLVSNETRRCFRFTTDESINFNDWIFKSNSGPTTIKCVESNGCEIILEKEQINTRKKRFWYVLLYLAPFIF